MKKHSVAPTRGTAMGWNEWMKRHHSLVMLLCCGVPLLLLAAGIYLFGIDRKYLFWFVLLLCPLLHIIMMRDMHKDTAGKKKGGCH